MSHKMIAYLRLFRIKHWIKNFLLFLPVFFGGVIAQKENFLPLISGFFSISLYASCIYIFNDLCDIEKDRLNESKKNRPLANRSISKPEAIVSLCIFAAAATLLNFFACHISLAATLPFLFVALNIAYSLGLKNKPILDLIILVSGYVIRVLYGSMITNVPISGWFYMVVISLSFFLAFGKRRNEKRCVGNDSRPVLEAYTENFLNQNMYLFLTLFIMFYALWSLQGNGVSSLCPITVPIVIVIMLRYSYLVEKGGHGDPVSVIFSDKILWVLGILYIGLMNYIVYFAGI